jgi:hypothetical protein
VGAKQRTQSAVSARKASLLADEERLLRVTALPA